MMSVFAFIMAGSFFMVATLTQFADGNNLTAQILFAKFNFFLGIALICKTIEDKKESS